MREMPILHVNPRDRSERGGARRSRMGRIGMGRSRFGSYRTNEGLSRGRQNPLDGQLNPFWKLAQKKAKQEKEGGKMAHRRKHRKHAMKHNPAGQKITTEQVKKFISLKKTMTGEKAAKSLGLNAGALWKVGIKKGLIKKGKKAGKKVTAKKAAKKVKAVAKTVKTKVKKIRAKATKVKSAAKKVEAAAAKVEAAASKVVTAAAKVTKVKGKARKGKAKARPKAKVAPVKRVGLSAAAVDKRIAKKVSSMKKGWRINPRPKEGIAMQIGTVVVSGFVARLLGNLCRNGIVRLAVPTGTTNDEIKAALTTQAGFETIQGRFDPKTQNIRKFFFINANTMGQGVVFALASTPWAVRNLKAMRKVPLVGRLTPKIALGAGLNFGVSLVNLMVNKVTGKAGMSELQNLGTLVIPSRMGEAVLTPRQLGEVFVERRRKLGEVEIGGSRVPNKWGVKTSDISLGSKKADELDESAVPD